MAEFQEVMRQWGRYCKAYTDNHNDDCSGCLFEADGSCNSYAKDNAETAEQIEKNVMAWAAEHPEPVYPTWAEWLEAVGVVSVNLDKGLILMKPKIKNPIPADIAEKLGIEPKEG